MSLRELLTICAVVASLIWLGAWDRQRTIERVMSEGHETSAMITGATRHGRFPIAFDDDWRPRWRDQQQSLTLKWKGRDGVVRQSQAEVTDFYWGSVTADNNRVAASSAPVKVIDEDGATPVILADVEARRESMAFLSSGAGYAALALWPVIGVLMGKRRLARRRLAAVARPGQRLQVLERVYPARLLAVTAAFLVFGGFTTVFMLHDYLEQQALAERGVETTAQITKLDTSRDGKSASNYISGSWTDKSGGRRRFDSKYISPALKAAITRNGALSAASIRIRYLEDDPSVRPVFPSEEKTQRSSAAAALAVGAVMLVLGLIFLRVTIRYSKLG